MFRFRSQGGWAQRNPYKSVHSLVASQASKVMKNWDELVLKPALELAICSSPKPVKPLTWNSKCIWNKIQCYLNSLLCLKSMLYLPESLRLKHLPLTPHQLCHGRDLRRSAKPRIPVWDPSNSSIILNILWFLYTISLIFLHQNSQLLSDANPLIFVLTRNLISWQSCKVNVKTSSWKVGP